MVLSPSSFIANFFVALVVFWCCFDDFGEDESVPFATFSLFFPLFFSTLFAEFFLSACGELFDAPTFSSPFSVFSSAASAEACDAVGSKSNKEKDDNNVGNRSQASSDMVRPLTHSSALCEDREGLVHTRPKFLGYFDLLTLARNFV